MATENEPLDVMELEENLSDVEKPPEIPNGTYAGEVQDVINSVSAAGNPYWAIRVRIPPEEIPPDMSEFFEDGVLLTYNRLMKPTGKDRRALYNLKVFLNAIGLDANVTSVDPNEWMGRPIRVIVKQSPYQGENRANIAAIEAGEVRQAPVKAPAPKKRR